MKVAANLFVVIVAIIHFGIMGAEMLPPAPAAPRLLSALESKLGFAEGQGVHASPIVRNAGLFNGFLAAGLIWGWKSKINPFQIRAFFLTCVIIAGIFGALTLPEPITLWIQTLPGIIALVLSWLAQSSQVVTRSVPTA